MTDAPAPPVPFVNLREWALFALEEWANARNHNAILRSFELRLVLAWLYSTAPIERAPFDAYWRHATRHIEVQGGAYELVAKERARCMRRELTRIYAALGLSAEEMHERYRKAVADGDRWYAHYWKKHGRKAGH